MTGPQIVYGPESGGLTPAITRSIVAANRRHLGLPPQAILEADEPTDYDQQREYIREELLMRLGDTDLAIIDLAQPFDARRLADAIMLILDAAFENHP